MKERVACPYSQTKVCAMLNIPSCQECTINVMPEEADRLAEDIELFQSLLPQEGLYSLFEGEDCVVCKGEHPNKKDAYAILDVAHPEPKRLHRKPGFLFKKESFGFMVPLQFAICSKCRMKYLFLEYITLLVPVLTTIISLLFVSGEAQRKTLAGSSIGFALPLIIVVAALVLGYAIGKVLQLSFKKKWASTTHLNLTQHPFVQKMQQKGWFVLFDAKKVKPVFVNKPLQKGLGTAGSSAYKSFEKTPVKQASEQDDWWSK